MTREESDIEKLKPCINYEDGCEEWAGCPCVYYKSKKRGRRMTEKEAAKHLLTYSTTMGSGQTTDAQHNEAKRIAIKALEREACGDCISRENTLKAMIEQLGIRNEDYLLPAEATLYKVVKNMPPVTPQPKTGRWKKIRGI